MTPEQATNLNQLDKTEAQALAELREVYLTTNTAGWQRIRRRMVEEVEKAHEAMLAAVSDDPMTYMRTHLRWQQRELMLRDVDDYIAECNQERTRILEEIKEREEKQKEPFLSPRVTEDFERWPVI